jgi:DNA-binding GntR family transcriptional regulator
MKVLFEAAENDALTETYRLMRRRLFPLQTRHPMCIGFDEIVADHERLIGALEAHREQLV